jgi:hypothetical protein
MGGTEAMGAFALHIGKLKFLAAIRNGTASDRHCVDFRERKVGHKSPTSQMHISIFVTKLKQAGLKWLNCTRTMEIKIQTITGSKYMVDIEDTTSIADVKTYILEKTGIPAVQQRYVYKGRMLKDDEFVKHLPEASTGMTLNMILSLRGG